MFINLVFYKALIKIYISNMRGMFYGCSDQFHNKIRSEYKNIKEEAFNED